jgi:N-glycosylase/DNA lyase
MYAEWRERDPNMFGRLEMAYEGMKVGEGGRARGVRLLRQDPWECLIAWVPSLRCLEGSVLSTCRFITSTNNHIPRIAGLMLRLGTHFSPPLLTLPDPAHDAPPAAGPSTPPPTADSDLPTTTTYHLFPAPHLLPVVLEQILRDIGFGYRAGFIESSLATLRADFGDEPGDIERGLAGWRGGDVDIVREKLIGLKGVGRKVADCVMLMCLDQVGLAHPL